MTSSLNSNIGPSITPQNYEGPTIGTPNTPAGITEHIWENGQDLLSSALMDGNAGVGLDGVSKDSGIPILAPPKSSSADSTQEANKSTDVQGPDLSKQTPAQQKIAFLSNGITNLEDMETSMSNFSMDSNAAPAMKDFKAAISSAIDELKHMLKELKEADAKSNLQSASSDVASAVTKEKNLTNKGTGKDDPKAGSKETPKTMTTDENFKARCEMAAKLVEAAAAKATMKGCPVGGLVITIALLIIGTILLSMTGNLWALPLLLAVTLPLIVVSAIDIAPGPTNGCVMKMSEDIGKGLGLDKNDAMDPRLKSFLRILVMSPALIACPTFGFFFILSDSEFTNKEIADLKLKQRGDLKVQVEGSTTVDAKYSLDQGSLDKPGSKGNLGGVAGKDSGKIDTHSDFASAEEAIEAMIAVLMKMLATIQAASQGGLVDVGQMLGSLGNAEEPPIPAGIKDQLDIVEKKLDAFEGSIGGSNKVLNGAFKEAVHSLSLYSYYTTTGDTANADKAADSLQKALYTITKETQDGDFSAAVKSSIGSGGQSNNQPEVSHHAA